MPANLTPEYRRAEELFRQAGSTAEKIAALELMLQTIPKHKGTDHMQADIKRRLAKLRDTPDEKSGARQKDIFYIPRGASAGQVVLLGTPNSGKSALVAHLTNAHVQVADYPFATTSPVPGILQYEDVQIQLVDMPPITADHTAPGQVGAYRQCDLILVVMDLAAADVTEEWTICLDYLRQRNFIRTGGDDENDEMFRHLRRPCMGVCTKSDLASQGDFEVLQEMCGGEMELVAVSTRDQDSLDRLAQRIFQRLRIVRIYSKLPGKKPDMQQPFTLTMGSTVHELAHKVHRDLAEKLRYARIWADDKYPGQQVPRDYVLRDKDIIELHFS